MQFHVSQLIFFWIGHITLPYFTNAWHNQTIHPTYGSHIVSDEAQYLFCTVKCRKLLDTAGNIS